MNQEHTEIPATMSFKRFNKKRDCKYLIAFIAIHLLFWVLITLISDCLLSTIEQIYLSKLPTSVFLIKCEPYSIFWFLPALFLGLIISEPLAVLLTELALGKDISQRIYREFLTYGRYTSPEWKKKYKPVLSIIVLLIICCLAPMLIDWYARFGQDQIAINPFFGWGEIKYKYGDITRLVCTSHFKAQTGTVRSGTQHYVCFRDGCQWCTESYNPRMYIGSYELAQSKESDKTAIRLMDFLSVKTGKPIEYANLIEDVSK